MISSGLLERPGAWRAAGIAAILGLAAAAPAVLVVPLAGGGLDVRQLLDSAFPASLGRSLVVAGAVGAASLVAGLSAGLAAALFEFPLRRLLLAALALPLLVPSFLWAIGLSMLRIEAGLLRGGPFWGAGGCVVSFAAVGVPLVCYTVFAAARSISRSQVNAARLAGGDRAVLAYAARNTLPAAALAALLAAVLSLADPGPGQILGYSGAATQILTSFSALYDFDLAAVQCLVLGGVVLALVGPMAWWGADRLSVHLLAGDVEPAPPRHNPVISAAGPALLGALVGVLILVPLAGLAWPAARGLMVRRALQEVVRTAGDTLFYGAAAAAVAVVLAGLLAVCAGRDRRLRRLLLAGLLVLFALPPSLSALGLARLGTLAPPELDALLRSRMTVGWALGVRFLPVAAVLLLRSVGSFSPSWASAAAMHGVGLARYLAKVLLPMMAPAAAVAAVLVALLATAEVGTVLLLQPPGAASLTVAIFTVMANAPESLVATLCLLYVAGAAAGLTAVWAALLRRAASPEGEGRR